MQYATIIGMSDDEFNIMVQSVFPEKDFRPGGKHEARKYRWPINHYTYQSKGGREFLGLDDAEYAKWDKKFKKRYNPETDKWNTVK
jgi:hypothetical protein